MELVTHLGDLQAKCPYCNAGLRRIPGAWLGRGGFECRQCGEFIDFSRPLTAADGDGVIDEDSADDLAPVL